MAFGEIDPRHLKIWLSVEFLKDDQLEPIYNNSVPIQGVALKTYRERWTIEKGGRRGSERSVLVARHDDDDDDDRDELTIYSRFYIAILTRIEYSSD